MIAGRIVHSKKFLFVRKFSRNTREVWNVVLQNSNKKSLKEFINNYRSTVDTILENTEITRDHLTPELKLFLLTENCSLYHAPFMDENQGGKIDSLTRNVFQDPFWSIYWPGGQVLTRFILDDKERISKYMSDAKEKTLKILDLGAGCGATAIAAKSIGTWKVVANDINEESLSCVRSTRRLVFPRNDRTDLVSPVCYIMRPKDISAREYQAARIDVSRGSLRMYILACVAVAMNAILNDTDIEISWENLLERSPEDSYDVIFVGDLLYDEEIAKILIAWLENAYVRGARIYLGDPGRHGLTENLRRKLRLLRRYPLPENVRKENHGYDTATVWEFVPEPA